MDDRFPSEAIVTGYIQDVLEGRIPACHWVKQACRRHVGDLLEGDERGLYFDAAEAQLVIDFIQILKQSKGEWAGRQLRLEPWQQFIIWTLFGWRREDGTRRFRTAYLEVARKNGKSTLAAAIGLYLLVADGEPGAEIYSAATKRDQALITHSEAERMVKSSPSLNKRLTVYKGNIHIKDTASKYEPLSADYNSLDGLNPHGLLVDELHAHKTRGLWDVLETATGSRRQPLMAAITTAGFDRQSICYVQHEYTEKILDGVIQDDSYFGIIYTLDRVQGDDDTYQIEDWTDERAWIKANPNLGVSKKLDNMRQLAKRAKEMPSALNAFLRLHLNVWTQAETKWIPLEHWNACGNAVNAEGLRGRTCYGGLDLSSNIDISAFVLVFPPQAEGDEYRIIPRFWIPEDAMVERSRKDRVPYDVWVRQGFIEATPGNVIDYKFILHQIDQDMKTYDIQEVAFDRWGATKIMTELAEKGSENFLVQFGQGFVSMSPPMKELERLILEHKLAHGNNPVLTWMANNLVARQDPAGNIKPDKEKSIEKIDGLVALIMALDRALRHEPRKRSVYEDRGLMTI